jgi:hypothetical protein
MNNNDKLLPIIKDHNDNFINKLSLIFKDLIPKEQQQQTQFCQDLSPDTSPKRAVPAKPQAL